MRLLLFIALLVMGIHFIPDQWIENFVMNHITIHGDGEEAMDSFEMNVIVIKTVLSGICAYVLQKLLCWLKNHLKK
ncbi:hypothetical protein QQF21_04555 [Lelliottia sp. V89_10]|uniref:hypothetical protein n=1 Tax=Lelliottia wanjuensis TaxID=3050585 RepID=UPI00249E338F|nr:MULTISPECIES: hypothetical protein [unclassified Lelliottia]MDI3360057.1 hypothetical protein [Lelliottia sp. V89_13]MDK9548283.1 hypothetical protein [Lelliottia sp. V89_5]MDK9594877.1 hypothetical protein [Lelliottia sp. V89_10]MDK9605689.1 hypothetical protein [Lelliottia sp. V104_15]